MSQWASREHYDLEQFPGLVYRTQNPKSAALIFRSGKIVCTGAKSTDDGPDTIVQNIVSSADLGRNLNLNADRGQRIPARAG